MTKSQIPINDLGPISKSQKGDGIQVGWSLDVGIWTLIGLLLLKFFPPRQDFLVAAEGSVGIWDLEIGPWRTHP